MLTGRAAFAGDDVSDTLAAVLMKEPDWAALPSGLSPTLVAFLKRCLHKDVKHRVTDIGAVRLALDGAFETAGSPTTVAAPSSTSRGPRAYVAALGVAVLSLAAGVLVTVLVLGSRSPRESPTVRFQIPSPDKTSFTAGLAFTGDVSQNAGSMSPDGRRIAFTARNEAGQVLLWVRALDAVTAQPLPGTDGAALPFWSPNSRSLGFFTPGNLKRIDVDGGPVQTICAAPNGRGGTWNRDGVIVFVPGGLASSLLRVSASGGEPSPITTLRAGETVHWSPSFLPDGRRFLYWSQGTDGIRATIVGSLDSADTKRLLASDSPAVFASPGYLLFLRQGTLLAQPFDAARLEPTGDAVPIAEQVASGLGRAFSVSETGTLAYRVGPLAARFQLTWVDRSGAVVESFGEPALYQSPALAPDGKRVAVHRHDVNGGDVWLLEVNGGRTSRLTFDASQDNSQPLWSADGTRIVFGSRRNNKWGIYQKLANGTGAEELLYESDLGMAPMSWSATNTVLFYVTDPKNSFDVWALPLTGDRKPVPLLQTRFGEQHPHISPNGKWFAYASNETGRTEVYLQTLPPGSGKWQVSVNGGWFPRWRPDGKELFWMDRPTLGKIVALAVEATGSTFEFSAPRPLFDAGYANTAGGHPVQWNTFDVSADGKRFLIPRAEAASLADTPLTVVLNWTAALNKK